MKLLKKRKILLTLSLALLGGGLAVGGVISSNINNQSYKTAEATDPLPSVNYVSRSWDGSKVVEETKPCSDYTVIASSTTSLSTGWYVVNKSVTNYDDRITISGTVNLILCDNVVYQVSKGIKTTGATLNIYGQSEDSGLLWARLPSDNNAGIGGDDNSSGGTLNVYGGSIRAKGGSYAAAIGSGRNNTSSATSSGAVTVYGGVIYAVGGSAAAGIGAGKKNSTGNITVNSIKVYGGNITAQCGYDAAGIGSASNSSALSVYGPGLNVLGKTSGIPTGASSDIKTDYGSTRYGGMRICKPISYVSRSWDSVNNKVVDTQSTCLSYTVVSVMDDSWSSDWFVVNKNIKTSYTWGYITIYGTCNLILSDGCTWSTSSCLYVYNTATLNIYGQSNDAGILDIKISEQYSGSPAIGGKDYYSSGIINIYGGTIKATGGKSSAGIGTGYSTSAQTVGDISIYGGNITAKGGSDNLYERAGAGIGGGAGQSGGNVTIYGGFVNAIGGKCGGAGIGGGFRPSYLNATESSGAGGTVTIKGGAVKAFGGQGAMGIGYSHKGTDNGSLSVDNGFDVYGGASKNPGTLIEKSAGDYARYQYMVVKSSSNKLDPTTVAPTYVGGASDQTLNTIGLSDGWSWENPTAVVGDGVGFNIEYVPENTDVYNTLEKNIDITVVEPVSYIDKSWNATSKSVVKTNKTCTTYRTVSEDMDTTWTSGWYLVNSDVTFSERIVVDGIVNLILGDGYTLTANKGISIAADDTINIYGQSDGDNVGKLVAITDGSNVRYSPLGGPGDDHSGAINIYGGDITAKNINPGFGDVYGAAGIGGGSDANSGPITIYGGKISAQGGKASAGIGGGFNDSYYGTRYTDEIIIYDGTIVATGGEAGPGIGGGGTMANNSSYSASSSINVGPIKIYGGNVTANGGAYLTNQSYTGGAGIGCGYISCSNSTLYNTGTINEITIYGGVVNANGGNMAAGIGSSYTSGEVTIKNITINGGTVTSTGYSYDSNRGGAGIGSGYADTSYSSYRAKVTIKNITVNGGTVTATGDVGPGIGLTNCGTESSLENITVNGGFVQATGSSNYDAIGCATATNKKGTLATGDYVGVFGGDSENPETVIEKVDDNYARYQYMIVKSLHEHSWSYSVSGNAIHAACNADNCPIDPTDASLNLSIKQENFVFNNNPHTISFDDGYSNEVFANEIINIAYYQGGSLVAECINAGEYEARVTVDGATISSTFTITQATPTGYVLPTGLEATYGDNLSKVVLPNTWSWKTPADKVGDAGNRLHVAIYTPADTNYKAVEDILTVTVNTADPDPVSTMNAVYGNKLENVTLPGGWAWSDPALSVGNVGIHNFSAHYTAQDANHHDKDASLTVKVNQAIPSYTKPTNLDATYGDTLSIVTLPNGWSWKTPTNKVGNAGNQDHVAIYTPTDPNYKAVEETLTVSVAKATPTGYVVPTGIEAPYDVALWTVGLPEGFSWMDGTQRTSVWGEHAFKAKYTPTDTANYNVVENIDIKVSVKWILVDPTNTNATVTINGVNNQFTVNIAVKVEVKTEISTEEKQTQYNDVARSFIGENEDLTAVYDVKLIRTIDGVEEEIQPSDIEEGATITVHMAVPDELVGKDFRLLHIHSDSDVSEVSNYALSKDGKTLVIEVDKLSEFAFIGALPADVNTNGFDYSIPSLPAWAIILIILGSIFLLGALALFILYTFFPVYYIDYSKHEVRKAIYINTKHDIVLMLNNHLQKVRRNEVDVYEHLENAFEALKRNA